MYCVNKQGQLVMASGMVVIRSGKREAIEYLCDVLNACHEYGGERMTDAVRELHAAMMRADVKQRRQYARLGI